MPQLSREFQSRAVAPRFFRLSIYFNIAIRYLKANQAIPGSSETEKLMAQKNCSKTLMNRLKSLK